ncbi:MAG: bifunctional diaminohydroxyphosphoribosylaminopyrimidine deaminase/5-amino-6-(5-phosphoribosylamino)uracil reductase RibD [Gammaproteobacteria bacterium]|jgi:diaminohydroxyphosphoribosylaminopyrimidine deaminase/5-amino-6-(5-phosphoribosylamino)uracil reductase
MTDTADIELMARALRLAERGLFTTDPNPRVGCVVVRGGEIVGEGWHCRAGEPHAEVHALRQAGERARGAEVYVTLEPCCHHGRTPPCADALIAAGVSRVVTAMEDPDPRVAGEGLARLARAGIRVERGILHSEAERLNPGYIRRMRRGLPWVRCKMAMSVDGRTALANGESQWITGEAARRDVHYWRTRSSAVLTGIGTVLADDPALTARLEAARLERQGCGAEIRQPQRVVLDSRLRMPADARMFKQPGLTRLFASGAGERAAVLKAAGAIVEYAPSPFGAAGVDLAVVLRRLAQEGVNELWVEAGPTLSGAFLQAGLVDELILYVAPVLMGDGARGLFHLPVFSRLADCMALDVGDIRAVGNDWRISARPRKPRDAM